MVGFTHVRLRAQKATSRDHSPQRSLQPCLTTGSPHKAAHLPAGWYDGPWKTPLMMLGRRFFTADCHRQNGRADDMWVMSLISRKAEVLGLPRGTSKTVPGQMSVRKITRRRNSVYKNQCYVTVYVTACLIYTYLTCKSLI